MSLEKQLEIEKEMVGRGIERYMAATAKSEEDGRGSETSYGSAFIRSHLAAVSSEIAARIKASQERRAFPGGAYLKALAPIDTGVLAFIALRTIIDAAIIGNKLAVLCLSIGQRVQDEVRFRQFEQVDERMFKLTMMNMKRRNATDYVFQRKSLTHAMNHDVNGDPIQTNYFEMSKEQRLQTGVVLLDAAMAATGHFERVQMNVKGKTDSYITLSEEMQHWIIHHKEAMSMMLPVWTPTIIPPQDWTSLKDGGFYSPEARDACRFVITKSTSNPRRQRAALQEANLSKVYEAINHLQKTRWAINLGILDVSQQVWQRGLGVGMPSTIKIEPPPFPFDKGWDKTKATEDELKLFEAWKLEATFAHTDEKERVGKCAMVSRIIATAARFKDEPNLYFVWHCDFRNRMYSVASGLSPQSSDLGKAMLRFSEGKPLRDASGVTWFKIHGANTYGVDKVSFADRIKWVDDNREFILRMANDPLGYKDDWGNADKPYQFLAWALEYKGYCEQGVDFVSHLPIGQDGSCNGLQHFSAMLRDPVGGKATNLVDADVPSDIYQLVANRAIADLRSSDDGYAQAWIEFGITRSTVKRCVMTLPYGSTRQGCRDFLLREYRDSGKDMFDRKEVFAAVSYLTNIVWNAIGHTVVAARAAMDWLQEITGILSSHKLPMEFTTPSGWVVHQAIKKVKIKKVQTVLLGRTFISLGEPTDDIDKVKQRNGVSPNFVHSMDAAHLISTITKAKSLGIDSIAAIHDDYGVHACDSAVFARVIRECFVEQYRDNVLLNLHSQLSSRYPHVELPLPPEYGTLDINEVLSSKYFFA